ncbi:MAG: asparagine synthetase B family protein, partial [Rhizobiaceae bacterium]
MLVDAAGGITVRRHADLEPEAAGTLHLDEDAAVAAFEEAFSAAVRDRLQGDVPVGVFLSAGVDSNTVAATMREVSNEAHPAFTIGFDAPGYGEADEAALVADQLGFEHSIERIGAGDLDSHFARAIWHAETIAPNGQGTAKMRLSANASAKVKVILAGEGADEIHGGYAYLRHAELLKAAGEPGGWRAILRFLRDHGFEDGVMARATPMRRNKLAGTNGSGVPYAAVRASLLQYFLGYVLRRDFQAAGQPDPAGQLLDWLDLRAPGARKLDDVTLSRFTAAVTDMPSQNLTYLGDRAEMAHGIEGRLPYLDKRVVDLLWGLPYEFHMSGTSNKTVIRRALTKRLPQSATRYKRMFMAPANASKGVLEGPIADRWLSQEAIESCGYFRPRVVRVLRSIHDSIPLKSEVRHILAGFLMTAISAHMLDHLFCRDFSASLDRYTVAPSGAPIPGIQ